MYLLVQLYILIGTRYFRQERIFNANMVVDSIYFHDWTRNLTRGQHRSESNLVFEYRLFNYKSTTGPEAINFLPGGVLSGFNNSVFTIFILIYSSFIFYPPAYWPPLCNAMQCKDHYHLSSSCLKAIYGIGFCFQDSTSSSYIRRINHLLIHGKWSSLIPLHPHLYPSFNKSQPSEETCQNLNDQFIWLIDLLFPSLQAKSSNIWIKIAYIAMF